MTPRLGGRQRHAGRPAGRRTRRRPGLAAVGLAGALLAVAGCGSARRGEPLVGPLPGGDPSVARGARVFMARCHACHPGGETGLGPALNDKPLPGLLVRLQVRHGLGAMPAFTRADVSDADLGDLVAYLEALRRLR